MSFKRQWRNRWKKIKEIVTPATLFIPSGSCSQIIAIVWTKIAGWMALLKVYEKDKFYGEIAVGNYRNDW